MSGELTDLLQASAGGDRAAQDRLFALLYAELRTCAHRQLRGAAQTLSTTALVHETYVKLSVAGTLEVASRQHFMALAARAMRQVLIDHARRIGADKRGGASVMVTLDEQHPDDRGMALDVLALDQALTSLAQVDARAARIVQLHFFGGLNFADIAELEDLAVRTVMRDWQAARAYLGAEMSQASGHDTGA